MKKVFLCIFCILLLLVIVLTVPPHQMREKVCKEAKTSQVIDFDFKEKYRQIEILLDNQKKGETSEVFSGYYAIYRNNKLLLKKEFDSQSMMKCNWVHPKQRSTWVLTSNETNLCPIDDALTEKGIYKIEITFNSELKGHYSIWMSCLYSRFNWE